MLWSQLRQFWDVGLIGADRTIRGGLDYTRSLKMCRNSLSFLGVGARKLTEHAPEFENAMQRCNRPNRPIRLLLRNLAEGHLTIKRLKGSRTTLHQLVPHRGQPLLDEVKAMKEWLAVRPTDAGDAPFPSQKGGCMSATQFYRVYRATADRANRGWQAGSRGLATSLSSRMRCAWAPTHCPGDRGRRLRTFTRKLE